ncbi:shikimate kinase [Ruminococcus flavefaciens]|uniref:shikimate kinase n=1 Tax=Ruminococcus flavefaciens TaxID=1265 RepID=UPI0026F37122|nr:shikimate kinase [Ruminococcus flavefaciens]MDD7515661.1 shikimate kinase [Ruminococcus flavefaciens]MDY5690356.1 shikimate kinase [Ruminococcus flavefaciens]
MKKNIVLIGMPGVGKSTVGVILAKLMGYKFVDTDLIIQEQEKKLLKEIIAEQGIDGFIETENRILSHLDIKEAVIATGGSVVYGSDAMKKLSKNSIVVYLKLDYNKLKYRLGNIKNRGVVIRDGQSLSGLYKERVPLYEKYADVTIDENGCNVEKTVSKLLAEVNGLL